jgi:sucrose-6-phosphate hydrolase SacC (GH32 family)
MVAVEAHARLVVFYRSADLRRWAPLSELGPLAVPGGLWECPDIFALPVEGEPGRMAHVLVLSANDEETVQGCGTWYAVGSFDGVAFTPDGAGFRRLDHGPDNYAAVTWNDAPDGRRVMVGWMANWMYARDLPTGAWRGAMTVPRELSLRRGREGLLLVQRPAGEVTAAVRDGALTRHAVELDVRESQEAGFELEGGPGEVVRVGYDRASGVLSLDRRSVGGGGVPFHPAFPCISSAQVMPADGVVTLEVLVDSCSVEVFAADGEVVMTALVYPSSPLTVRRAR